MSTDARETILARMRSTLEAARAAQTTEASAPRSWSDPSWRAPVADRVAAFRERLESVGGNVWVARAPEDAEAHLDRILTNLAPAKLAVSDSKGAQELAGPYARAHPEVEVIPASAGRGRLIEADVGITCAQHGIAETGTLVLESSAESHRLVSLLPTVHIALLAVPAILGTLGDALEVLREPSGAVRSRTVTFVTGPSRTADIELTLVVGVHGPKELHVILIPEDLS